MSHSVHLLVEEGPDKERALFIPPGGARIGRSSSNDIVLSDLALSRFHCRFFFRPDGALWIADLGSTNETKVNGVGIQEQALQEGDRVEIGGTVMRVMDTRPEGLPAPPPDLGLEPAATGKSSPFRLTRLVWPVAGLLALLGVAGVFFLALHDGATQPAARGEAPPPPVSMTYEKVQADTDNIFRYHVRLQDGVLAVRIDNLADSRHVAREQEVDAAWAGRLATDMERAGFFDLQPEYAGLAREVWDEWDISLTMGPRHHRVRVLNRVEPDGFRRVREMIEEFVRNELGLAALALPPERLLDLAQDAYLQGRKLFDQRDIRHDNLARAIASFTEAVWYLDTIEPKPDFYPAAVSALEECRRELEDRYQEALFRSERAIKLREWDDAARFLRVICAMIPDRNDDRHQQARRKLLDVERRMERR